MVSNMFVVLRLLSTSEGEGRRDLGLAPSGRGAGAPAAQEELAFRANQREKVYVSIR
jgi:hypothetical protein